MPVERAHMRVKVKKAEKVTREVSGKDEKTEMWNYKLGGMGVNADKVLSFASGEDMGFHKDEEFEIIVQENQTRITDHGESGEQEEKTKSAE